MSVLTSSESVDVLLAGNILTANVKDGIPITAEVLLVSSTTTNINPTSAGYAGNAQIPYAGANLVPDITAVTMDANGTVTFNETGVYFLSFYFQFTRATTSGTANLVLWSQINDLTSGIPVISKAQNSNILTPAELTLPVAFTAGDTLKGRIMRDTSGANDGGLGGYTVADTSGGTSGPNNGASCSLIIYRLKTA